MAASIVQGAGALESKLRVDELSVALTGSGAPILNKVSFELHAGEIFALVGESGSGKSMTALAVMRLLPDALQVTGGAVSFGDQALFSLTEQEMQEYRGRRIAMIFQDALTSLNPVQRVGDQVVETLRRHTELNSTELTQRVVQLFTEVGIPDPEERVDFFPHQLSGGQQQRIMIAMALACEPDVLVADEPTTALDVTIQQQVLELIGALARNRDLAVLLITHDMGVVRNTADRVGVMYQGEIIEEAAVDAFFDNPQQAYSKQLIDSLPDMDNYLDAVADTPLLEVKNLEVYFPVRRGVLQRIKDYTKAVDDVSFTIGRGETLALVGESGSGKSTIGRAILNLEPATGGEILYQGELIQAMSRRAMLPYRKKIQVIFQSPFSSMNPRMTVGDIIEEGMISLGLQLTKAERAERIVSLLTRVRLDPGFQRRYPHEFSGGQRQRIAIARALAVNPELIICDEPTSALDVSIRAEVLELLLDLQREYGVSYLFITHDLSIVPHLAHHLAVMQNGKIVEQGTASSVLEDPQHPYTKALLASVPRIDR
ncbi:MAG: ABC-type microcin C transport system duplicated ATPase subunit YejF [Halieaceae bacterium]|jgi:ABC-type microcin C transport system duplicated ATPase subunit YejF